MNVRVPFQATTAAESCESLILNYFSGCSRSPLYRYPCSAKQMMQKLGKYSIELITIKRVIISGDNLHKYKFISETVLSLRPGVNALGVDYFLN